jgi:hypothetical protein
MLKGVCGRSLFIVVCLLSFANAHAQSVLFSEVHTIADPTQAVPVEHTLSVTVAGTYSVQLVDLGASLTTPAPLASVKLAITSGSSLVQLTPKGGTAGTTLVGAGTATFAATAGDYVIHVVGLPGTVAQSGPIALTVSNTADSSVLATFSDTLALPGGVIPTNVAVINDTFTVGTTGSYIVTLSDFAFPQALTTHTVAIETDSGTLVTSPPLVAPGSVTVSLQTGVNYHVIGLGVADSSVNAGLFGASVVTASGSASVYSKLVPIGAVAPIATVPLTAGGMYTLSVADLSYPKDALTSIQAVVAVNGTSAAQLTAPGTSQPFTSVAATYQVFALASSPSIGSYALTLAPQSGAPVLSIARGVTAGGTSNPTPYSYDANVATAGAYAFTFGDFAFPSNFVSINAATVQNGVVVGQPMITAGSENVNLAAGPVSVLVFGQPGASGSLYGVDLGASGAPLLIDETQGVGQLFTARKVSVTQAGSYAVNVIDVGFPAKLSTFAVMVTQGATQIGSAFGGGQFTWSATPGNYAVNFIAQPGDDSVKDSTGAITTLSDAAGTYSLTVGTAPDVKLNSDVTSVTTGGVAHLSWTSDNDTSCTASGGWSGDQPVTGSATTAALTAKTTFTLTCSGGGATGTDSVTVDVAAAPPPPASTGGGGGAITEDLLLALFGAMVLRVAIQQKRT